LERQARSRHYNSSDPLEKTLAHKSRGQGGPVLQINDIKKGENGAPWQIYKKKAGEEKSKSGSCWLKLPKKFQEI